MNPKSQRKELIFKSQVNQIHRRTDTLFAYLMAIQWAFAILFSVVVSPYAWEGAEYSVHIHVWSAFFLGGAIALPPIYLAYYHGGAVYTRHVTAVAQALMSALLIHLTGGRIETHFHIFGSLAFLSFYRDWKVIITASLVIAADHIARGILVPLSVFGVLTASPFRALEHVAWVVFEDVFLIYSSVVSLRQIHVISDRQAAMETLTSRIEKEVDDRTQELKDTQQQLIQTQKLDSLGKLASGIAHDFNNVLGGILAHASLLRLQKGDDPELLEGITVIESSAARGAELTKKLLAFARKGNYERKQFAIGSIVGEAVSLLKPSFPLDITIEIEAPEMLPNIDGDSTQILQVIMNLLMNARDAMPKGGSIRLCLSQCAVGHNDAFLVKDLKAGDYLKLTVKDSGSGIPTEIQHRIFEPFFTTKKLGQGTGLGLAMVYGIVKTHGGSISVDSHADTGTTFELFFPAAPVQKMLVDAPRNQAAPAVLNTMFDGLHILVAEDDSVLREAARGILLSCGAEVTAVENGAEAVEAFRARPQAFAAVLLDVVMPVMDGVAAFHAMKDEARDTVFIVVSGYAESHEIANLRNQFGVSFLSKPYTRQALAQTIHVKLQSRKVA